MKSLNLNNLKPKKLFSMGVLDLPHVGDLSRPFFITIGCSLTAGVGLEYKDTWSSLLGDRLDMEHINLSMAGSSLDYQYDTLLRAQQVLTESRFTVWMHTYPTRFHWIKLRHILGDKLARRGIGGNLEYKPTLLKKISKLVSRTQHQNIIHTNTWGYDLKTKLAINKQICRTSNRYMLNHDDMLDYASDGSHAGPLSHHSVAVKLYGHIYRNFPRWYQ